MNILDKELKDGLRNSLYTGDDMEGDWFGRLFALYTIKVVLTLELMDEAG